MLTNRNFVLYDDVDFLHNYYERLVVQEIYDQNERVRKGDRDFLADVACVALNRLPPRYIRHDVDMTFFMSPQDMIEIEVKVEKAVQDAIAYVQSRERGEPTRLPPVDVSLISTRADKPPKNSKVETNTPAVTQEKQTKATKNKTKK